MNWNVKEISSNVHQITFETNWRKNDWEQWVLLSGDRHHDNPKSDHKLQKKHLDEARERGAAIIDVGDFFCLMQGKYDKRGSKKDLRAEHQVNDYFDAVPDTAVNFFKPYADLFAVIGYGNHEMSIKRHHETDILQRFVYRLNAEAGSNVCVGGYGGYVKLLFTHGKRETSSKLLHYFHGSGGGGEVTRGVTKTARMAVHQPDSEICVTGHIHEKWTINIPRVRVTSQGRVYHDNQLHVCTGTYKEEYGQGNSGWHVERGSPPKPLGGYWLRFTSTKVGANNWRINVQTMDAV